MKKMNRTKLCAAVLAACIAATAVPAAAVYAAGSGSTTESTAQAGKSDKERRSPADEWVKEGIISEKTGENVKAWLKENRTKKTADGTETQAADGTGTKTGKGGRRGAGIGSETLDELVKAGILTKDEAAKILEREDSRKEKKEAGGSAV